MIPIKNNRTLMANLGSVLMAFLMIGFIPQQALSQDKGYDELEQTQDQIEDLNFKIYNIIAAYPKATYDYTQNDGGNVDVVISGIPDDKDKDQLRVYLINLKNLEDKIMNQHNRMGIYYATETLPKPKIGWKDFYDELQGNVRYPKRARELGLEGNIYVKFVVTPTGSVQNVSTVEKINDKDTYANDVVAQMTKEAKDAVIATSGDWEPGKIGGVPVYEYRILPVQFKLKSSYYFYPML